MTRYARGAAAEREYMRILEDQGYYVTRSAGSHACADLLACRDGRILLVQVKTDRAGPFAHFGPRYRKELLKEAAKAGGEAVLAWKEYRKGWRTFPPDQWPATGLP